MGLYVDLVKPRPLDCKAEHLALDYKVKLKEAHEA